MSYHLVFPHRGFLEMILYGHTHDYHGVFSYIFPLGFKEFYPDISMYIQVFPTGFFQELITMMNIGDSRR
jgi:hypothetical protein